MPSESVIVSDPEIMGGTSCFAGTRVPVDSPIDYLEAGDSLDEFLDNFPSVSRETAIAGLEAPRLQLPLVDESRTTVRFGWSGKKWRFLGTGPPAVRRLADA